jgi:hypothetical protein
MLRLRLRIGRGDWGAVIRARYSCEVSREVSPDGFVGGFVGA